MTVTSAPSRWSIDLASLVHDLPPLEPQPPPSIRRSLAVPYPAGTVSSGARQLPHLPVELVALVLAHADAPTLAAAARVCWVWLREASPVLYESVVIARHQAFDQLFLERDGPISLALEPYLSLHQIRHLTLLVQPSTPPSTSRLSLSSSPPPHPLLLKTLSISLAYTGLIGYAPFLALVRPTHAVFRPCFRRSSKYDFSVEQRSWHVVTGAWMAGGRLKKVECVGCNLTCRMRVGAEDGVPGEDEVEDEGAARIVERFIAVPRAHNSSADPSSVDSPSSLEIEPSVDVPETRTPPLSVVYDLTTLPPLTLPFYRHFLLQRSIDGVFTIPGLRSPSPPLPADSAHLERRPLQEQERGVTVVVKRQPEAVWVSEGLALIRPDERRLVRVVVLGDAGAEEERAHEGKGAGGARGARGGGLGGFVGSGGRGLGSTAIAG